MLDLEQLLSDLRDLEHELNSMGVEAVLDERDDGMPEFHFGEFGGGLEYDKKGFRFTIWAGEKDNVFETVFYKEFRHELIRRLANQYERKAEDVRDGWKKLSGDDTPMPDNLVKRADGYSSQAEKLRDAIQNDDVPMLLSEEDQHAFPSSSSHDCSTGGIEQASARNGIAETQILDGRFV